MAETKQGPIKVFSMEPEEFFKVFIHDALVVYSPREISFTFASNVKETVDVLKRALPQVPDVIFLSVAAPLDEKGKIDFMAGFKLLKILKGDNNFKNIPVIIFSKYDERRLQHYAKTLGAVKYLIKGQAMPKDIAEAVACSDKISMPAFKSIWPWG